MRDPNRIDKVLEKVKEAWSIYPDARLTQLIENITYGEPCSMFFVEDDRLVELLDMYIKRMKHEEE